MACQNTVTMPNRQKLECGSLWNGEIRLCGECKVQLAKDFPSAVNAWNRACDEADRTFIDHDYHAHTNESDRALWNSIKPQGSK